MSRILKFIHRIFLKLYYGNKMNFRILHTGISIKVKFQIEKEGKVILGRNCCLSNYIDIKCFNGGMLKIGENTFIGPFSLIHCMKSIEIGKNCMIGEVVSIRDNDHIYKDVNTNMNKQGFKKGKVVIGNNVWIGAKATILSGVEIGDNSIIAAHAVVNVDVPSNVIVGGIPAKIIKERNKER